jgi:hypothetical protein
MTRLVLPSPIDPASLDPLEREAFDSLIALGILKENPYFDLLIDGEKVDQDGLDNFMASGKPFSIKVKDGIVTKEHDGVAERIVLFNLGSFLVSGPVELVSIP